jgi:hypothetical protein
MSAQGLVRVGSAKEPAPLQQWDHLGAEDIQHRGNSGGMMLKPSAAPSMNQSSIKVGDLLRRAGGREMTAGAGETGEQLP